MLPRDRFDRVVGSLESFYHASLDEYTQDAFYLYCKETFVVISRFEKAVNLVMAHEPKGKGFPPFAAFGSRFADFMRGEQAAERQAVEAEQLERNRVLPGKPLDVSYHCLCCLDSGLLPDFNLEEYLNIKNHPVPQAYACTRCDLHHKFPYNAVRHVSQNDCEQIHQAELERRRETDLQKTIARLKSKIQVAVYLKQPQFRDQAIAEANARQIPLNLIGAAQKVAA